MDDKLNIGCGEDYRQGWINVDKYYPMSDLKFDLNVMPYPIEDNSIIEVNAEHVIEHLERPVEVMKEIHRICKGGAKVHIKVPNFSSSIAFTDPTHLRFFSVRSFDYYDPTTKIGRRCGYEVAGNFKVISRRICLPWWFEYMNPIVNYNFFMQKFYEDSTLRGLFPAGEMKFELVVVKPVVNKSV